MSGLYSLHPLTSLSLSLSYFSLLVDFSQPCVVVRDILCRRYGVGHQQKCVLKYEGQLESTSVDTFDICPVTRNPTGSAAISAQPGSGGAGTCDSGGGGDWGASFSSHLHQ